MNNKDLISFLNQQVDEKSKEIGKNNMKNVQLRMDRQHIKSAIEKLKDVKTRKHDE